MPVGCYQATPLALQLLFSKHFHKDFPSWEHTVPTGTLWFTLSQVETFLIHVSRSQGDLGLPQWETLGTQPCWLHAWDCSILMYLLNCKFIFSQKHFTFHSADSFTGVHCVSGLQYASSSLLASAFPSGFVRIVFFHRTGKNQIPCCFSWRIQIDVHMLVYVDDLSVLQGVFGGCGGSRYQSRGKNFSDASLRNSQLKGWGERRLERLGDTNFLVCLWQCKRS